MSESARGPIVVDTGVFGARLTPRGKPLASGHRPLLAGRPALISGQGPNSPIRTLPCGPACVQTGHGLGQKEHEADRWVSATAIWLDVPLVAHDAAFNDMKGLDLHTRL